MDSCNIYIGGWTQVYINKERQTDRQTDRDRHTERGRERDAWYVSVHIHRYIYN